jgi:hypothetical protein
MGRILPRNHLEAHSSASILVRPSAENDPSGSLGDGQHLVRLHVRLKDLTTDAEHSGAVGIRPIARVPATRDRYPPQLDLDIAGRVRESALARAWEPSLAALDVLAVMR